MIPRHRPFVFFIFILFGFAAPAQAHYQSYNNQCDRYDYQIERVEYQIERLRDSQEQVYDRIDGIENSRQQALLRIETQYENTIAKYENCDEYAHPTPHGSGGYGYHYTYPSYCKNADSVIARAEDIRDQRIDSTNAAYDRRIELAEVQAQKRYESLEYRIDNLEYRIDQLEEQKEYCEDWYSW